MSSQVKYFNFPIQLLEGFLEDSKSCLENIISYSVCYHAFFTYEVSEVDEHNEYEPDPSDESKLNDYRIKAAMRFYHINIDGYSYLKETGLVLLDSVPKDSPKTGLNVSIFWDYFNNHKTEFEKAVLLCHLALKSIVMNRKYAKTQNLFMWSRMNGNTKSIKSIDSLDSLLHKYTKPYQRQKIIDSLRLEWGLSYYGERSRGFYFSYQLDFKDLALAAEKKKKSRRLENMKKEQREIAAEVRKGLNSKTD